MPLPIEDYAFISDTSSGALIGKDGSIDWLAFPRFDSDACFAALLGGPEHGRWLLAPTDADARVQRRYVGNSLILETVFTTGDGEVAVTDFMPPRDSQLDVIRIVEGRRGRVEMHTELIVRFVLGSVVPWVRRIDGAWSAVAGPDALHLVSPVELRGVDRRSVAEFVVEEGDEASFVLTWHAPTESLPRVPDPREALARTQQYWEEWSGHCTHGSGWLDAVNGSLTVLKGLTYAPTGGLVAAATTSLPEQLGGPRNWDYRFCWLRDATFTLLAMLDAGHQEEAMAWRDWLLRAVAGDPSQLQIMYGLAGERRLNEWDVPWLPGYMGALPVRIGNGAFSQFQLDVYGEVLDCLHQAAVHGGGAADDSWSLQKAMVAHLERVWTEADEGIWEVRGPRRHFTHSKLMAWVAFDRIVRTAERFGLDGDVARWKARREEVRQFILQRCVDDRGVLTQYEGTPHLDASLLVLPMIGFLPVDDPRVRATVEAIERELCEDGFVLRYRTREDLDGLPPGEGAFLLCTFWLADALHLLGRKQDALAVFERLLALRNDVGLLSEQVEPHTGRFLGNIPQAFSHTALVNTATTLSRSEPGAAQERAGI